MNESNVTIYFIGHKGFHITNPSIVFSPNPDNKLPAYFRKMALFLFDKIEIDSRIYHHFRLVRLPGSIHPKTDCHKIPLTYHELDHVKIEDIEESAGVKPSNLRFPVNLNVQPSNDLVSKYNELSRIPKSKILNTQDRAPAYAGDNKLSCIAKAKKGAVQGERHDKTMLLANYYKNRGYSQEGIWGICTCVQYNNNINSHILLYLYPPFYRQDDIR